MAAVDQRIVGFLIYYVVFCVRAVRFVTVNQCSTPRLVPQADFAAEYLSALNNLTSLMRRLSPKKYLDIRIQLATCCFETAVNDWYT